MKRSRATSLFIVLVCQATMPMSASIAATPSCNPVRYTNADETKWRAATTNFGVWNYSHGHDAARIAKECEKVRQQLCEYWCGSRRIDDWSPPCLIVVHGSKASYLAAAGRGAAQTEGTCAIWFDRGTKRQRIDLLPNGEQELAALPHEMTHVLLFDLLGGKRPPPWADEGAAILADSETKRELHTRDARDAIRQQTTFQYSALLQCDEYPAPRRIPAFYGQSAFLAATLVSLRDASTFIDFLEAAKDRGYDQALRDIYGIEGITALERCAGAAFSATNTISALQSRGGCHSHN